MTRHERWCLTGWDEESGVNPPSIPNEPLGPMSKGELLEYHSLNGSMALFYDMYPESKPKCMGVAGCPCPACCRMRGRESERER